MIESAVEDLIDLAVQSLNMQFDSEDELDKPGCPSVGERSSIASSVAESDAEGTPGGGSGGAEGGEAKKHVRNRFRSCVEGAHTPLQETAANGSATAAKMLQVLDRNSKNAVASAAKELRRNYAKRVADKLAHLTKTSLKILSKHFAAASSTADSSSGSGGGGTGKDGDGGDGGSCATQIVFVLTAYLSIPEIEVRPSIDEVQGEK